MVRMIGAMPAVAVRQQRKHIKHDDHKQRPSTLTIDALPHHQGAATPLKSPRASPHTSPVHSHHGGSPVPSLKSPVASPKSPKLAQSKANRSHSHSHKQECGQTCVNGYLFGHISLLHISVICIFLGITLLVVGLVQLAPSARHELCNTELNKYAIIGSGAGFLAIGFTILIILCVCHKSNSRKRRTPAQLLQKQAALAKSRSMQSKCSQNKTIAKTPTKQAQIQSVDGAIARGRSKSGVHPLHRPPLGNLENRDGNKRAFMKPSAENHIESYKQQ